MTELYLIAHKVRGEPTFDVAERMICPSCDVGEGKVKDDYCEECNDEGYWWILSTSGYRVYPWWDIALFSIGKGALTANFQEEIFDVMPPTSLDCFPINSPSHKSLPDRSNDLLAKLGLTPKLPPLRRL